MMKSGSRIGGLGRELRKVGGLILLYGGGLWGIEPSGLD